MSERTYSQAPGSDSQGWEIWPIERAVTTPNIVRLRREEALHWLRHGDKNVRDRAERTIESLRHHPNDQGERRGQPPLTCGKHQKRERLLPVRSTDWLGDRLRMDYINSLPQPFIAHFYGGDEWPIYDIEVQTGLLRIDVCGKLQVKHIGEVRFFRDDSGVEHDSETFYSDYESPNKEVSESAR